MEKPFTTEHGSREWEAFDPLKNDRISMFGTPHAGNTKHVNPTRDKITAGKYETARK